MTTANSRTDSTGRPWSLASLALHAHELPQASVQRDWSEPTIPLVEQPLGKLLGSQRSSNLDILAQCVLRKGALANTLIRYCYDEGVHFIEYKSILHSISRGKIREKRIK